jgi:hypothetical protein
MSWNTLLGQKRHLLFKVWNFWFPFLGAGIRITEVSADFRSLTVRLRLRWWNRNYVGTQFGGSMFMMTDPFYMVMFLQNLGHEYIVWDKAAGIRYLKPGKTDVIARFTLTSEILDGVKQTLETQEKMDWTTTIQIKDLHGEVVAEVDKVVYIRKKNQK